MLYSYLKICDLFILKEKIIFVLNLVNHMGCTFLIKKAS